MHFADFRAFAREVACAVHEHAEVPVTLGSARLMWVRVDGAGTRFLRGALRSGSGGESTLAESLSAVERLDRPLWLGELPARDPSVPGYRLHDALNLCLDAGLSGAAVWRWTKPEAAGTDRAVGQVEPAALESWASLRRGVTKTA